VIKSKKQDIVVDTNVFVHTNDENNRFCVSAQKILKKLIGSKTLFCIDEGFDDDESKNKSFIGYEYHTYIRFGTYAYGMFLKLLNDDLVREIPKRSYVQNKRRAGQYISDSIDKIFLSVTLVSDSKKLISNDFQDFNRRKRIELKRRLKVDILSSDEGL